MQGFWQRFLGNRASRSALRGSLFVVLLLAATRRCSPPAARSPSSASRFAPPFGEFLFGTDSLGRDVAAGLVAWRAHVAADRPISPRWRRG